jgi:predicted nucleic acid-binding protein
MSDYIVDASVVIQVLITDTYTNQPRVLLGQLTQADQVNVPEFCLLECANVLWKQVRFQGMPGQEADTLLGELVRLPLTIQPVSGLLERCLQIGLLHQPAIYDSGYIAMAERLRFPLITTDTKQEAAARAVGITLKPITDFS